MSPIALIVINEDPLQMMKNPSVDVVAVIDLYLLLEAVIITQILEQDCFRANIAQFEIGICLCALDAVRYICHREGSHGEGERGAGKGIPLESYGIGMVLSSALSKRSQAPIQTSIRRCT
jgi:hypothetical protein